MVPPVELPPTEVFAPAPLTGRPPDAPVVLSTMPLAPPLALMLLKVRPAAPIVVLATFSAVPVVVVSVLVAALELTVPPAVAVKAGLAPVDNVSTPVKLMVALVLLFMKMPAPLLPIAPLNVNVPPVVF